MRNKVKANPCHAKVRARNLKFLVGHAVAAKRTLECQIAFEESCLEVTVRYQVAGSVLFFTRKIGAPNKQYPLQNDYIVVT